MPHKQGTYTKVKNVNVKNKKTTKIKHNKVSVLPNTNILSPCIAKCHRFQKLYRVLKIGHCYFTGDCFKRKQKLVFDTQSVCTKDNIIWRLHMGQYAWTEWKFASVPVDLVPDAYKNTLGYMLADSDSARFIWCVQWHGRKQTFSVFQSTKMYISTGVYFTDIILILKA